jgi:hypothetical protein
VRKLDIGCGRKVSCFICNKKFREITWMHCKFIHGISLDRYKKMYPSAKIISDGMAREMSRNNSGYNNPMYGKHHTEVAKMKISNRRSYIGDKNPFYGMHHSDETKKHYSTIRSGRNVGSSNPFYGKTHSNATKIIMRKNEVSKKLSDPERYVIEKLSHFGKHRFPYGVMNKMEKKVSYILRGLIPGIFMYNGNKRWGIELAGMVPDFVNVNGHKVIEVYSDYWKGGSCSAIKSWKISRSKKMSRIGWKVLYIGEADLTDVGVLKNKIMRFAGAI